jgi:hypothetical protein
VPVARPCPLMRGVRATGFMERVLLRTARKKSGQLLVAGAAIAAGVMWLTGLASVSVAVEVLGFAVIAPVLVWQWLDRRPRLILDDQGLSGHRLSEHVVPWTQVRGVELRPVGGLDHVWVEFAVAGQPTPACRAILASDLDLKASELVKLIRERAGLDRAMKSPGP